MGELIRGGVEVSWDDTNLCLSRGAQSYEEHLKAFLQGVKPLLKDHRGKFAIVYNGEIRTNTFYSTDREALLAGRAEIGPDTNFLVFEIDDDIEPLRLASFMMDEDCGCK